MTDRISSFQSSPATTFYLEGDVVETQASYGDHGRWRVRLYLRAMNGPGGSTGSFYGGSGYQDGRINGGIVITHGPVAPFLPSGYANGATRWRDGPVDWWVNANSNGYWSGSSTSLPLQMGLDYGSIETVVAGSMPLPRIARAPGAPGTPTVSNLTPTSAKFTWSAAARGNSNITDYGVYVSTDPSFGSHVFAQWIGTGLNYTIPTSTLNPGTTYYVRVRARNGDGTGGYSGVRSFTTLSSDGPSMVISPSPAGSSALIALSPPGGITGVDKYTVHWEYLTPPPVPSPGSWSQDTTGTSVLINGLIPGATYRWTATATIGGYTTPASGAQDVPQPQPSTGAGDYFDGSTPAKTDVTYAWTGTTNNSTSTMSGLAVEGWEFEVAGATGGGVLTRVTGGLFGLYSAQATITQDLDTTTPAFRVRGTPEAPYFTEVEPNTTYYGSIYVNPSRQSRFAAEIIWFDEDDSIIDRTEGQGAVAGQGIWTRLIVGGVAPAGAVHATVGVCDQNGTGWAQIISGDVILVDGAMISLGELFSYFDGATPDTLEFTYEWTGTANASTSTRTALDVQTDPLADPDCPPIPAAPRPPFVPSDCIADVGVWRRYWVYIPASEVPDWLTVIPTLEIQTGVSAERQVRIRMYANPFDRDNTEIDTTDFCSEQIISYIPPNTVLTLDGVTERVWAEVQGGAPISGDHLLYGSNGTPATWPHLSCGISYWASFDVPNEAPAGNLTIRAYLTQRT